MPNFSIRHIVLLAMSVLLLFSCKEQKTIDDSVSVPMDYAQLLKEINKSRDYTTFVISDPWQQGKTLQQVSIAGGDGHLDSVPSPAGILLPHALKRVVVFTTAHCQLLEYLGVADRIVGVCDAQYILVKDIRRRLGLRDGEKWKIVDCGSSINPDIERIIALKPDAIILSPYEGMGLGRLEKIGIPIILAADYMETSGLGRAEWMRYYGRLFGEGQRADSLFNIVDSTYQSLKRYAASLPVGRSVLTERKTGAVWYTPGGRSSIGVIIHDAHGRYAFSDDAHSGSLSLSAEQILAKAGQSDVWAFKYNGPKALSKADLLREYHGYEALKAFRTGEIYECNCSRVPYFEEVSWRPDYLLREMIQLLHPGVSLGGLRYYKKL